MAYILDARGTGGAVIALGEAVTFPVASGRPELDAQPPKGSLRYNPDLTELELFRSDGLGGHGWRIVERISLDTSTIFQKTGGTIFGDVTMTGAARMFLPSGSIANPSLAFAGATQTGFSTDSDYVLHASVNGIDVAKFDLNLTTINVPLQAASATFESINTGGLNVTALHTSIPREITAFFPAGFTQGQVIFRHTIAHRVSIADQWNGSVAFVQTKPTGSGAFFSIDKISGNIRTAIGNIQFAPTSLFGTFWSLPGGFELDGGDVIEIVATTPDGTKGLSFSLLTRMPLVMNVAPSNISLNPSFVEERAHPETVVGVLSVTDTDSTDFNFQLLDSAGDRFAIIGNQIVVGTTALNWLDGLQLITVRAIDEDGLSYDKTLTIGIRNIVDMAAYDPLRPITLTATAGALVKMRLNQSIGFTTGTASAAAIASIVTSTQLQSITNASLGTVLVDSETDLTIADVTSTASVSEIVKITGSMTSDNLSAASVANVYVQLSADETLENYNNDGNGDAIVIGVSEVSVPDFESSGSIATTESGDATALLLLL